MDTPLQPLPPGVTVAVSGISQYQEAARATVIGDDVLLTHEISNPYDRFAVRIDDAQGNTLGYVPRAGQQNQRLLVNNSGAVFAGVIVDKFDNDTCGLRVRITHRIGRRDDQFGSDRPGIRDLDTDQETAPQPPPVEPAEATHVVFSKTGRQLGTLIDTCNDKVRARLASGSVVSYPVAVVEVRPVPTPVRA